MERKAINPWDWSLQFGFNQGEVITGATRVLKLAGQTAIDGEGNPQHEGDLRGQMTLALDNIEAVLKGADMDLSNLVQFTIYTTDVPGTIENYDVLVGRLSAAGIKPPQSLIGVAALAFPSLMIEIEATAMA